VSTRKNRRIANPIAEDLLRAPMRVDAVRLLEVIHAIRDAKSSPRSPRNPLERAREALAEYDYDARAAFTEALEAPALSTTAAVELLALLVEELALDDDALALEPRLPDDALARADVRALVGLAYARARGDHDRAARLVRGNDDPRAADARLSHLPWPDAVWDAERLEALSGQARTRLESLRVWPRKD
jgi:hypothetical protein